MKEKIGAALDRNSGSARNAIIFFALAMVFRCLGLVNRIGVLDRYTILTEIILPVFFCALMILCILFFGKRLLILSMFPMAICLLFFILRSLSADNIMNTVPENAERVIRLSVYLLLAVIYSFTVQTDYRFKWILVPVFFLGIVYHLVFEDYPAIFHADTELNFAGIMMELAVIFILLALMFLTFSFRKKGFIEAANSDPDSGDKHKKKRPQWLEKLFSKGSRNGGEEDKESGNGAEIQSVSSESTGQESSASQDSAQQSAAQPQTDSRTQDQPRNQTQDQPQPRTQDQPQTQPQTFSRTQDQIQDQPQNQNQPQNRPQATSGDNGHKEIDESFFDKPYHATLTLDPQPDPDENGNGGL